MRKVQALLDRADGTNYEAERDACIAKADQLMAAYAIEAFELDMARPAQQREKPEVREFDLPWIQGDFDLDYEYRHLFDGLVRHTGCLSVNPGGHKRKDWLEWLFTSIRLHMLSTMIPKPSPDLSLEENLALLKETGLKWQDVYEKLVVAFPEAKQFAKARVPDEEMAERRAHLETQYPQTPFTELAMVQRNWLQANNGAWFKKEMIRSIGVWFTKVYTEYCREHGKHRTYASPTVYRRSFIDGYMDRIRGRLYEMRQARGDLAVGKELVLANRESDLKELLYELRPELRPHPPECECDPCHGRKCTDAACDREYCKERRKPQKYRAARYVEPKIDLAAQRNGSRAANSADLMGGRHNVGSNPRKLDS